MASVTVRNLPDETHRALRVRAATHGRSTEAEIRAILESAVRPEGRVKLGTLLAASFDKPAAMQHFLHHTQHDAIKLISAHFQPQPRLHQNRNRHTPNPPTH